MVADRRVMVHGGTLVTSGTGTRGGGPDRRADRAGRIAELMRRTERHRDAAARGLAGLARMLPRLICVVAGAMVAVALGARLSVRRRHAWRRWRWRSRRSRRDCRRSSRSRSPSACSAWRAGAPSSPAAGGRDARLDDGDLHRQDRHPDAEPHDRRLEASGATERRMPCCGPPALQRWRRPRPRSR